MQNWTDGIKVGNSFNAWVKRSPFSKTMGGVEGEGRLAHGHFHIAKAVGKGGIEGMIETHAHRFNRRYFVFERIGA